MSQTRRKFIAFSFAVLLSTSQATNAFAAAPAPVKGEHGMVVTAQHLASEIGVEVMKQGGNAIDAAVAVGYALAVVHPSAGNIGGGGFMTIRFKDGSSTFLDFRERAPLASTKAMYLDKDGNPIKGASLDGYLAVGVPGSVAGLEEARTKYGTLPREKLLAPAIRLAKEGFVLNQGDAGILAAGAKRLAKDEAAKAIFLKKDDTAFGAGERLVQTDLATSLSAISEKGPDAFYKEKIADSIVAASKAKGGILAKEDFEQYKVRELKPVTCSYRGYEIVSSPPPSSGGLIICEILNVLEGYPISYLGFGSAETVPPCACSRGSLAAREAVSGYRADAAVDSRCSSKSRNAAQRESLVLERNSRSRKPRPILRLILRCPASSSTIAALTGCRSSSV